MKNFFGREAHPSDFLVHWSEPHVQAKELFEQHVDQLRNDWDLLTKDSEQRAALGRLLAAQRGVTESGEANDGALKNEGW